MKERLTNPEGNIEREYNHQRIEKDWTEKWQKDDLYATDDSSPKPKSYVLYTFPNPSGGELHIGQVRGFTATDITARFNRMNGYEVLSPVGWDTFGQPAENVAAKTGEHPKDIVKMNSEKFRLQCQQLGLGVDWNREINTSDEEYYKWTQWIFLQLHEKGLVYKPRNSSESESEEWYVNITQYADRLIDDLEKVEWPEHIKKGQREWVGLEKGYELEFGVTNSELRLPVFISNPEDLLEVPYIALAPDHPFAQHIINQEYKDEVDVFIRDNLSKEVTDRVKEKPEGIFTGSFGINPLDGKEVPIYLMSHLVSNDQNPTIGVRIESRQLGKEESVDEDRAKVLETLGDRLEPSTIYKLRDWQISRNRSWGTPNPLSTTEEDQTLDPFLDSSWYYFRFCDPNNTSSFSDKRLINHWMPIDTYFGGLEHRHLIYSRFITKFLYDEGHIDFDEPFLRFENQGMMLGEDGQKMSKSRNNVVESHLISEQFGADSLRLYTMSMGPFNKPEAWNPSSLKSIQKFVKKTWDLQYKVKNNDDEVDTPDVELDSIIQRIGQNLKDKKYNVAVSGYLEYANILKKNENISRDNWEKFLLVLAPVAPFITEELWKRLGNEYSIHLQSWPETKMDQDLDRHIPIQVNGKVRSKVTFKSGKEYSEDEILQLISNDEDISSWMNGNNVKRIIYVPGKIINLVIE